MALIRNQKLLYHLTSITNLTSILSRGLLPRDSLAAFEDVAEPDIIEFRGQNNLNRYVPFHFFANNPFDGRVQIDHSDKEFIFICISRSLAHHNNFPIIPLHPMAMSPLELYDYEAGFALIEWDIMEQRIYTDTHCKHICMAECLAPRPIMPQEFSSIFVKSQTNFDYVIETFKRLGVPLSFHVNVNPNMFRR